MKLSQNFIFRLHSYRCEAGPDTTVYLIATDKQDARSSYYGMSRRAAHTVTRVSRLPKFGSVRATSRAISEYGYPLPVTEHEHEVVQNAIIWKMRNRSHMRKGR